MKDVLPDSTNPAILRPNLDPLTKVGSGFIPMKLPPFGYSINLPSHVTPKDAFGLFDLFFTKEQLQIICDNTIKRQEQLPFPETPGSRAWDWRPLILSEIYGYLGIRIYMGIHVEDCFEDY